MICLLYNLCLKCEEIKYLSKFDDRGWSMKCQLKVDILVTQDVYLNYSSEKEVKVEII